MERINGREIAENIYARIKDKNKERLRLVIVMAGANKATESFVVAKRKAAEKTGVEFEIISFPIDVTTEAICDAIKQASENPEVTAIVPQLPFPTQVDKKQALLAIDPKKDVDSLNGGVFLSPAVGVVIEILDYLKKDIRCLNLAVIGYGELVGRPIYDYFSNQAKSVMLLRRGSDLVAGLQKMDVIVSGAGQRGLITPNMIKDGAVVIDFGCDADEEGNVKGDFDPAGSDKNIFYTPTPGGTGPILVAKLFENITSYAVN